MSQERPMIDVRNVTVSLGGTRILEDVSMAVDRGDIVGLIGPNGAGKSTLLRTINTILEPESGTVTVNGRNVHRCTTKAVSRLIATVPQNTAIAFDFDVRDIVTMGRTPYRDRIGRSDPTGPDVVERALARTETLEFVDRSIDQISGGERQRVILARALAQDTPVLILDEPTASLDINHQIRTFELVRDLADEEGKTIIAAVHDLNLASHYCDSLVLLSNGRVLEIGSPGDVLTESNINTAFETRAVVTSHPVTGSVYITALPEQSIPDRGIHVHVIGGGGSASRLLYVLTAAGFTVTTGALNEGDSDLKTARLLGLETVTLEPFSPINPEIEERIRSYVERADFTVIADVEIGTGNRGNLEVARHSRNLILIEERPFSVRNYAGEAVAELYHELKEQAMTTRVENVIQTIERDMDTEKSLSDQKTDENVEATNIGSD